MSRTVMIYFSLWSMWIATTAAGGGRLLSNEGRCPQHEHATRSSLIYNNN